jgi:small-conductance mechanosensitive channel/CRP-like cAMP-binding protein
VGFFETLVRAAWADWTPWLVVALIATAALIRALSPGDRPRVRALVTLVAMHLVALVVTASLAEADYDYEGWDLAALAFALLAAVGMGSLTLFRVVLPRVGLPVPRILTDLFAAAGFVIVMIIVGRHAGFSVAGLITTSAVVTAVIGFSLQDTLGNIMGGLALQLDNSIRVGDWVALGVGQPNGKVTEIRWRYTAIETRNWETIIVPNSVLMKNAMVVLGRRSASQLRWRRSLELFVDFRTPPTRVIEAVQSGLRADPPPSCARDPQPHVLFAGVRDSYAVYWVRYWLHDFTSDDGSDSEVRTRVYFIMRRAGIPFSIPAQALFITQETAERTERKHATDMVERTAAIAKVALFDSLPEDVRRRLAAELRAAHYAAGEAIVRVGGDDGGGLYVISHGRAVVRVGDGKAARDVATLEAGQFFGEMSLLTGASRSASVVAASDLLCYALDRSTFQVLMTEHPELAEHFAETLTARQQGLAAAHGELEEVRRRRRDTTKHDLLGKIRGLFGLDDD